MSATKYRLQRRSLPTQKSRERRSLMSLPHWTLGEHRSANKKRGSRQSAPRQRKQVVYDDFGEPLRVVWVEDS